MARSSPFPLCSSWVHEFISLGREQQECEAARQKLKPGDLNSLLELVAREAEMRKLTEAANASIAAEYDEAV